MNWLRQQFCKHEIKIIEDLEWVTAREETIHQYGKVERETRKYMYCPHCGYKKKVSNR